MAFDFSISPEILRKRLTAFWRESLRIERTARGLIFTMPISYPDGWQVVLELRQLTPQSFDLNDRGRTLAWLQGQGLNVQAEAVKAHLQRLSVEHSLTEQDGVFHRWLDKQIDATDIHVFAEGLAAVGRLDLLNEHRIAEENVANATLQRVFQDAGLKPERNYKLSITPDRKVTVDFFVEQRRPLALQILKTRSDLTGTMERWGYRWDELKKAHQGLASVMLYDRNTQVIGSYERHIGESRCELFCGYDETDRIHAVLESVR